MMSLLDEPEAARTAFTRAIKAHNAVFPHGHPGQAQAQLGLATLCAQQGDLSCSRANIEASGPLLERMLIATGPTRTAWQSIADQVR
jgi:hypothetical protein